MSNQKNWIKSIILSVVIVIVFVSVFQMLGAGQEDMGIVVATIIIFTIFLCTYSIIDEIRKLNHNDK